jgi:hypothetical protein
VGGTTHRPAGGRRRSSACSRIGAVDDGLRRRLGAALLGSLDAIHLASAVLARSKSPDLVIATHDAELATAARAVGFEVLGASDYSSHCSRRSGW